MSTVNQLSTCVTAMTETVFSQSSRSFLDGVVLTVSMHVEQNLRLFSRLFWKKKDEDFSCHKNVYVVFFVQTGITPFMEVGWSSHHALVHCFAQNHHGFILATTPQKPLPATRMVSNGRDLVRLGRTENPSKSQLSHFFENDNKWIRLQHHVFTPLDQKNKCCRGCGTKLHFWRPLFGSGTRTTSAAPFWLYMYKGFCVPHKEGAFFWRYTTYTSLYAYQAVSWYSSEETQKNKKRRFPPIRSFSFVGDLLQSFVVHFVCEKRKKSPFKKSPLGWLRGGK